MQTKTFEKVTCKVMLYKKGNGKYVVVHSHESHQVSHGEEQMLKWNFYRSQILFERFKITVFSGNGKYICSLFSSKFYIKKGPLL